MSGRASSSRRVAGSAALQFDLAASLVFGMILVYRVMQDESRQPAAEVAQSIELSVLFEEHASAAIDQSLLVPALGSDRTYLEIAALPSNWPFEDSASWNCGLAPHPVSAATAVSYQTRSGRDDHAMRHTFQFSGSQVSQSQNLHRIRSPIALATQTVEVAATDWQSAFLPYFPDLPLPTLETENIWMPTYKVSEANCSFKRRWLGVVYDVSYQSTVNGAAFDVLDPSSHGEHCKVTGVSTEPRDVSSDWLIRGIGDSPVASTDPDEMIAAHFPYAPYGVFSCQSTGLTVGSANSLTLQIKKGTRSLNILGLRIERSDSALIEVWTPWSQSRPPIKIDGVRPSVEDEPIVLTGNATLEVEL